MSKTLNIETEDRYEDPLLGEGVEISECTREYSGDV